MVDESCETNIKVDLIELDGKLQRMMDGIDTVKERQGIMADDISKIKEAVYNPDEGIYTRLRELESWKKTQSKLMWIVVTSAVGIFTALIFNNIVIR
jgi:archaellum component FlaC